ncbi:MAG: hypothetical protein Q7T29_09865 [Gallionella sp.]|nr:hypothetical protein [Gallionella sp.]
MNLKNSVHHEGHEEAHKDISQLPAISGDIEDWCNPLRILRDLRVFVVQTRIPG